MALHPDTGKLKWHFQFTPGNGFFYVLDRATGEFLAGYPFAKLNWASGLDAKGRPIPTPQPPGTPTFPGPFGATNWYSPSYSPRTGLFYLSVWDNYGLVFRAVEQEYKAGQGFAGGGVASPFANVPMPPFTMARGKRRLRFR